MKKSTITTKYVYSEKNKNKVHLKGTDEIWNPIDFQWIPVLKLNKMNY